MTHLDRRWLVEFVLIAIPVALVFSTTAVIFIAMKDRVLVRTEADLSRVEFGWPFAWLQQDQSGYGLALPPNRGVTSPLDNPTSLSLGPFLVDVLIVFAVVMAVVLPVALVIASVRRRLGIH